MVKRLNLSHSVKPTCLIFQNVEESVLGEDSPARSTVGARVREIITDNLREPERVSSPEEQIAKNLNVRLRACVWRCHRFRSAKQKRRVCNRPVLPAPHCTGPQRQQ